MLRAKLEDGTDFHPQCEDYYDGFGKGNFLSFMRGQIRIFDDYIMEWKLKKHDHKEVLGIFYKKSFKSWMGRIQQLLTDSYYELLTDLTNTMMKQLKDNFGIANSYALVTFVVVTVLCIIGFGVLVMPAQKALIYFESTLFIFPIALMEKNNVMRHMLLKLRNQRNKSLLSL